MVQFNLRFPDDLFQAIKTSANRNRRSIHAEILRAIEYYLKYSPEAPYDPSPQPPKEVKDSS